MNFKEAMNEVLKGKRVRRYGWKYRQEGVGLQESVGVAFNGSQWYTFKTLCMSDMSGRFNIPYGVSEEDMTYEDWEVVE